MKRTQKMLTHIGAVALAMSCVSMAVQAATEVEPNSSVSSAQSVAPESGALGVSGNLTHRGMDPRTRQPIRDVDFYSFNASAGDRLDFGVSGVASSFALFGAAPGYALLDTSDSTGRISGYSVPQTGTYIVAVANSGAFFSNGGTVSGGGFEQGDYNLSVTGFALPSFKISIDVKPRHKRKTRINLEKKERVKVALLGSDSFSVADVDIGSLTFGANGDERTLHKCKRRFKDVNRDGHPDLVCKFKLDGAGFKADSVSATLRGETKSGAAFQGSDEVSVRTRDNVAHWKDDDDDDDRSHRDRRWWKNDND